MKCVTDDTQAHSSYSLQEIMKEAKLRYNFFKYKETPVFKSSYPHLKYLDLTVYCSTVLGNQ